jgi:antitoxin component HigA of HigAB toxin-antitoxin module
MNKTVGLKAKNASSKGKIKSVVKKPTLASLLVQQTPEKIAAIKAQIREIFGEDEDAALYDDIEKNRDEIIERNKLTWEHIKALQKAWKELGIPDSVKYISNPK